MHTNQSRTFLLLIHTCHYTIFFSVNFLRAKHWATRDCPTEQNPDHLFNLAILSCSPLLLLRGMEEEGSHLRLPVTLSFHEPVLPHGTMSPRAPCFLHLENGHDRLPFLGYFLRNELPLKGSWHKTSGCEKKNHTDRFNYHEVGACNSLFSVLCLYVFWGVSCKI